MNLKVEAERGKRKVQQSLKALEEYQQELVELGVWAANKLRERTPVDTMQTRNSWLLEIQSRSGDKVSWSIKPVGREEIVRYLEYGTKPHVILPVEKQVLRFNINGEPVFAKRVYHPGTQPLGFVRRTREETLEKAQKAHERLRVRLKKIWG